MGLWSVVGVLVLIASLAHAHMAGEVHDAEVRQDNALVSSGCVLDFDAPAIGATKSGGRCVVALDADLVAIAGLGNGIPTRTGPDTWISLTGVAGQVTYWAGTGSIAADSALLWDASGNCLGIGQAGCTANTGVLNVELPGAGQGSITIHSHSTGTGNSAILQGYRTGGTHGSESAIALNTNIMTIQAVGHDGTVGASGGYIEWSVTAGSGWTGSDRGTGLTIGTVQNGETVPENRIVIDGSGNTNITDNLVVSTGHLKVSSTSKGARIGDPGDPTDYLETRTASIESLNIGDKTAGAHEASAGFLDFTLSTPSAGCSLGESWAQYADRSTDTMEVCNNGSLLAMPTSGAGTLVSSVEVQVLQHALLGGV